MYPGFSPVLVSLVLDNMDSLPFSMHNIQLRFHKRNRQVLFCRSINCLVSWHCISLYRSLLFSHHLGPNLIIWFASLFSSISSDQSFDGWLIVFCPMTGFSCLVVYRGETKWEFISGQGSPIDQKLWYKTSHRCTPLSLVLLCIQHNETWDPIHHKVKMSTAEVMICLTAMQTTGEKS